MGQWPASVGTLLGAVDPVENAGVAQVAVGAGEAVGEFRFVEPSERREQPLPDRADIALPVEHLVGDTGKGAVAEDRIVVGAPMVRGGCQLFRHLRSWRTPEIKRHREFHRRAFRAKRVTS